MGSVRNYLLVEVILRVARPRVRQLVRKIVVDRNTTDVLNAGYDAHVVRDCCLQKIS